MLFRSTLAANILYAANAADYDECYAAAEETVYNGSAKKKLADLVECLGGDKRYIYDTSLFAESNVSAVLAADRSGYITDIDAMDVGRAAWILGAGRSVMGAAIDHTAGIVFNKPVGEYVSAGEAVATLQTRGIDKAQAGMEHLFRAITIGAAAPQKRPLVLKCIGGKY